MMNVTHTVKNTNVEPYIIIITWMLSEIATMIVFGVAEIAKREEIKIKPATAGYFLVHNFKRRILRFKAFHPLDLLNYRQINFRQNLGHSALPRDIIKAAG